MKILFTRQDGGVSVVHPASKEQLEKNLSALDHPSFAAQQEVGRVPEDITKDKDTGLVSLSNEQYEKIVWLHSIPKDAINALQVGDDFVLPDREFRNAWKQDGKDIVHDLNKALEIQLEKVRAARDVLLTKYDGLQARAQDLDDQESSARLKELKHKLRECTDSLKSLSPSCIEDIKKATPDLTGYQGIRLTTVFNVLSYGADPTGATSSQAAFQNAINAAKSITEGPGYAFGNVRAGTVLVPKGSYTGIDTLDCTNCVGLSIIGEGSWGSALYVDGQSTSYPVIDCSQSSYVLIENLSVFAMDINGSAPSIMPQCGVLFTDSNAQAASSNKNCMRNVNLLGWFTHCSLGIFNSTNNNFFSSVFCSYVLSAPSVYVGAYNGTTLTSAFLTLSSTPGATNENEFFGCEIHNSKQGVQQVGALWLDGVECFEMFGGILDSGGTNQPMVYFTNGCDKVFFSGVKFYNESSYTPGFIFYNNGTVNKLVCIGTWKGASVSGVTTQAGPGSWTTVQLNSM